MKISIIDYCRFVWQLVSGFRLEGELQIAARRQCDISRYIVGKHNLRILDLANGHLRPQYTILKERGYNVYGIDRVNRRSISFKGLAYSLARKIYSLRINGIKEPDGQTTLVCGDVEMLPFKTNSFNLVTSVAAFEHFLNVPCVITELNRVICPGGLAWIAIHPFACLSGGHNMSLTEFPLKTVRKGVDPWDHLRRRHLPFRVPLNEWRLDEYLTEFRKYFQIIKHYCAMREGEELLTDELLAELSCYSPDELTCAAYIIVARKPGGFRHRLEFD